MSYTLLEETVGDLRLQVVSDDDPSHADPRDATNVGVMMAEGHRHYILGDKRPVYLDDEARAAYNAAADAMVRAPFAVVARYLRIFWGATVVLPLGLYDHGGVSMYVGGAIDPWDSGLVGVIFDTPGTRADTGVLTPEDIEAALRGEVEEYDRFLRGEVYGYVIERLSTCDHGDVHSDHVDSCWGYIGDEFAISEGRSALNHFTNKEG